ncbi:MAG: hypothetical protein HZA19_06195, partial [Nitrospirae bacterium]|nr:hypothetical protein [Nitrospirota bacterium]
TVDSINPKIVSDNLRNVFVAWEISSKNSSSTDIYFNFSPDSGKKGSWLESEIRVNSPSSTGASTGVQMQTDGSGQIHLVWQNDRNSFGNSDIYYNGMFLDIRTLLKGPRLGEACFIATAAYGSSLEPHVVLLRQFRDQVLLPRLPGRVFISLYYRYSPPFARFLNEHPALKPGVRAALLPVIGLAALCVQTTILEKSAILILLVGGGMSVVWIRRRRSVR